MNSKQQRIDFPDYTADNQERDAKRFEEWQKKDVYIVKIRGHYGAYMPDGNDFISYGNYEAKDLKEFYICAHAYFEKLKIIPKLHCVHNQGIEDYILQQVQLQKLLGR
jgi:hypothetical protein